MLDTVAWHTRGRVVAAVRAQHQFVQLRMLAMDVRQNVSAVLELLLHEEVETADFGPAGLFDST